MDFSDSDVDFFFDALPQSPQKVPKFQPKAKKSMVPKPKCPPPVAWNDDSRNETEIPRKEGEVILSSLGSVLNASAVCIGDSGKQSKDMESFQIPSEPSDGHEHVPQLMCSSDSFPTLLPKDAIDHLPSDAPALQCQRDTQACPERSEVEAQILLPGSASPENVFSSVATGSDAALLRCQNSRVSFGRSELQKEPALCLSDTFANALHTVSTSANSPIHSTQNEEPSIAAEDELLHAVETHDRVASDANQQVSVEEVDSIYSNIEPFDNFIIQPVTSSVKAVGGFKPKINMKPKSKKMLKSASGVPDPTVTNHVASTLGPSDASVDKISDVEVVNPSDGVEHAPAETEAFTVSGSEPLHGDGYEDVSLSSLSIDPSSTDLIAENFASRVPEAELGLSGCNIESEIDGEGLDEDLFIPKEKASSNTKDTKRVHFQDADQCSHEGIGSYADQSISREGLNNARQLRKRKDRHSPVDGFEDASVDTMELSDETNADDAYFGEETQKQKKGPKKPKSSSDMKEGRTRKLKNTSDGSDLSKKEPSKKKFPHSTRRNRRRVNKLLLEIPEDEMDERKLRMKDLILLAEARERISIKEADGSSKQTSKESSSHASDGNNFDEDNDYAVEQDLDGDDDQYEAEPKVKMASDTYNHHSFMKRTYSTRWSKLDTDLFYQAIRQFGSNFTMIQLLFPNRTRHQLKLKFKSEERKHPLQIADALIHRSKDLSHFEKVAKQLQSEAAARKAEQDALCEEIAPGSPEVPHATECEHTGKSELQEDESANDHQKHQKHANDQDDNDLGSGSSMKYDESIFDLGAFVNDNPFEDDEEQYGT